MRVLYVEDEKFLAEAVKHNLGKEGIETDLAHKRRKIVIVVTHSRRVAARADEVLRLRRGKLTAG